MGLAGALAAQRDVLHHAAAAARVFNGTRAAVRDEILQEVAPRRDGPGAAELLRGEGWAKGKGEGEISALQLCGCARVCSKCQEPPLALELAVPQKQLALSPEPFKGIYQERNIARFGALCSQALSISALGP